MELSTEQITEIGLSEEQVTKLNPVIGGLEADIKKTVEDDWKVKASTDAEAILHGATQTVVELTGIQHEKGQKIKDYLALASENYFTGQKSSLERKQKELDDKIAAGGGNETLKGELEQAKKDLDVLKQKEAQFAEWEKEDYKTKYEEAKQTLSKQTLEIAFQKVKPTFPNTVNEYEAKGKWREFKEGVLDKYDIKLDDNNEPIAVDKANEYKITKLESLVKSNTEIAELIKGRQVTGLGSDKTKIEIEGVPFTIPKDATPKERNKAIKDYLTNDLKLPLTSQDYSRKFAEFNQKILQKTA